MVEGLVIKGVLYLAVVVHADHRSAFQKDKYVAKRWMDLNYFRFDSTTTKCCGCSVWAIMGWEMSEQVRVKEQLCLSVLNQSEHLLAVSRKTLPI